MENQFKNQERTGVRVSLAIMIFGAAVIVLPFLGRLDMFQYGYGMIFIGGFFALMGLISYLIFRKRALVMQKILTGNIIARWQYDPAKWAEMVNEEVSDTAGLKIMGISVGSLFLVIGVIFMLFVREDNTVFLGIMMAFAVLFYCIGFLSYSVHKKRLLKAPAEAIIARDGVYYMGTLTDWNGVTSILEAVGFHPKKTDLLVFSYRQLSGTRIPRMRRSTLCIPIPSGMEADAGAVVDFFSKPFNKDLYQEMNQDEGEQADVKK
ncbi:MAG: hypothetical protein KBA53_00080 [Thermoclostridium sp.]|nr:hypothetical protein [Thermoclostridium sp.]